jgi:hypothetical protein
VLRSLILPPTLLACLLLASVGPAACFYRPEVPEGSIRCDELQRCPRGSLCHAVRNGATVQLVCCRTPGCEAAMTGGTGATDTSTPISVSPPPGPVPPRDAGAERGQEVGGDPGPDAAGPVDGGGSPDQNVRTDEVGVRPRDASAADS